MKALLIGGTGTISLSITHLLMKRGWNVTLLNRGSGANMAPEAENITADISNEADVREKLAGKKFDAVAQFVAYTPEHVQRDIRLFSENCGQYLFVSSASAYHKPPLSPLTVESTPLVNPFWQYSRDKAHSEDVLMQAYREIGFPCTIVRPSHTYYTNSLPVPVHGRNGSWQVLERIMKGKPVLVPGDGTTLWTLTWAEDFAHGFVGLMGNSHAIGEAIHITSDEALTWNQALGVIAEVMDQPLHLCHVPSTLLARVSGADYAGSLLGDKANCALFDNTKIMQLVPDFNATTRFDQGARIALRHVLNSPIHQKADPDFDAFSDRVVDIMSRAGDEIEQLVF